MDSVLGIMLTAICLLVIVATLTMVTMMVYFAIKVIREQL